MVRQQPPKGIFGGKTRSGIPSGRRTENIIISPAGGFAWPDRGFDAAMPGHLTKKDHDILHDLLRLNREAAQFFEQAEKTVRQEGAQPPLCALKKLHKAMVENITVHVQAASASLIAFESPPVQRHFGALTAELGAGLDPRVVERVVEEEDRCLARMETALDDGLSMPAQAFLAAQLEDLGWAYRHMKALKATVKGETGAGA